MVGLGNLPGLVQSSELSRARGHVHTAWDRVSVTTWPASPLLSISPRAAPRQPLPAQPHKVGRPAELSLCPLGRSAQAAVRSTK